MMRLWIPVLTASALSALLTWQYAAPPAARLDAPPAPAERAAREAGSDAAAIARLRREIDQLAAEQEALAADQASLQDDLSAAAAAESEPPAARTAAEIGQHLERAFQEETADNAWSAQAEERIADSMDEAPLAAGRLRAVACHRTFCRAEVDFDDALGREAFVEALAFVPPWNTQGFVHADGSEDTEVTVFVAREGSALPEIPAFP